MSRGLPFVVWAAAAIVAGHLWRTEGVPGEALAMADTLEMRATAPVAGRLLRVTVEPGQAVTAGEIIAEIDAVAVEDRIAVTSAAVARAETQLASARETIRVEAADRDAAAGARHRAWAAEGDRLAADVAALQTAQAGDRGEVETLATQIDHLRPLVESHAVTADRMDELLLRRSIVEKRLPSRDIALVQAKARIAVWDAAQPGAPESLPVNARLAPFQADVAEEQARLAALLRQRRDHVIRAPADGRIDSVALRAGEWAAAGGDVAVMVAPRPGRVVAYVTYNQVPLVKLGVRVQLRPHEHAGKGLRGHVSALGPRIEPAPARFKALLTTPPWGRVVTISLDSRDDLLPGEIYDARFEP